MAQPTRCGWAGPEPIYLDYHDHEWGRPTHDDRALFELLSLEGMQAGLSWITILKKREAFRAAFADFEPAAVARFDEAKVAELMQNAGIVRNRRKIVSVIENARHFLEVQREFGSFDRFRRSPQGRDHDPARRLHHEALHAFLYRAEAPPHR